MPKCDFSERDYESSYGSELREGKVSSRTVFLPSQSLEAFLGFDSAAAPDDQHKIWQILKVPAPNGVTLQPTHWPNAHKSIPSRRLPTWPVSLMMQFKIPEKLKGTSRSKQFKLWNGDPYYRFDTDPEQHRILRELETRLSGKSLVRYAAPQFHTMEALANHQLTRQVIDHSCHVKPSDFDRGVRDSHKVWTYALTGSRAIPNPDGDETRMDDFQTLMNQADELLGVSGDSSEHRPDSSRTGRDRREGETVEERLELLSLSDRYIAEHFQTVAEACRSINGDIDEAITEWSVRLTTVGLSDSERRFLLDYTTIQSTMAAANSRWVLIR